MAVVSDSSQQRKPSSPHRQRSPDNLHPRAIRRRRPRSSLSDNARLRSPNAREVTNVAGRHRTDPARLCPGSQNGAQVVRWVVLDLVEYGGWHGGCERLDGGAEFWLRFEGGKVIFDRSDDLGGEGGGCDGRGRCVCGGGLCVGEEGEGGNDEGTGKEHGCGWFEEVGLWEIVVVYCRNEW